MLRRTTRVLFVLAVLAPTLLGCRSGRPSAGVPEAGPRAFSGSFSAITAEGEPVEVSFESDGQALYGVGVLGESPIVLGGALGRSAFATLTLADGGSSTVELRSSSDGNALTLIRDDAPDLVLRRTSDGADRLGALSGSYRSTSDDGVVDRVTLVEQGDLVVGVAELAGAGAGLTGRREGPDTVRGVLTFFDRSQAPFEAELSAERLVLHGLGAPIELERVESGDQP